jgi:2-(1,2-epoxy-1,2-dihydrophenyl)acetyl-CoA isomerase
MVSSIPTTDHTQPTTDVLVEHDDTVGMITINRPARLNAVTPAAGDTLRSAFLELEADSRIRAVVLTGAGRGFCAGADISGDVGDARWRVTCGSRPRRRDSSCRSPRLG